MELPQAYAAPVTSGRVGALNHQLIGIDHLIIGVRDLDAARAQYARLGFNSTPRGRHVGWGTANYCVMLERDYLELLGIVDASQFTNGLDRFLEEREGLLGDGPGQPRRRGDLGGLGRRGLAPDAPRALGRLLEARGRSDRAALPQRHAAAHQHRRCRHVRTRAPTPEPMRRPAWLAHPNGARAIRSCTIAVSDVRPLAGALRRLFGSAAITDTDNVVAAHTGHGVILVAPPEDAMLMHPLFELPEHLPEPVPVALTLEVADPDRAAAFLRLQGVPFARSPSGDVLVPPGEAHGVALDLVRRLSTGRNRALPHEVHHRSMNSAAQEVGAMARRLVQIALGTALLMVVVAWGAVAWLAWYPDTLKAPLERLLTAQLGQQVRIAGPLRVDPGRITAVEVNGLHIAAPEWARSEESWQLPTCGSPRTSGTISATAGSASRNSPPTPRGSSLSGISKRAPVGPAAAAPERRAPFRNLGRGGGDHRRPVRIRRRAEPGRPRGELSHRSR